MFTPAVLWPQRVAQRALVRTLAEVARGLLHMHRRGVLHGDIKVGAGQGAAKGGHWSDAGLGLAVEKGGGMGVRGGPGMHVNGHTRYRMFWTRQQVPTAVTAPRPAHVPTCFPLFAPTPQHGVRPFVLTGSNRIAIHCCCEQRLSLRCIWFSPTPTARQRAAQAGARGPPGLHSEGTTTGGVNL